LVSDLCVGSTEYLATSTADFPVNQWVHVAMVRNGGNLSQYINGLKDGENTTLSTLSINDSASALNLGALAGTITLNGYISNARIIKGTALYTTNFVPPTQPLTAIANTSLLACHTNRFADGSTNNFAVTRTGDAAVKSFNPFNLTNTGTAGSMYFDGTGDYLTTLNTVTIGSNDFTVEAWFYATTITGIERGIVGIGPYEASFPSSPSKLNIRLLSASSKINAWVRGVDPSIQSNTAVSLNTWYHVALVRSGTASNNVKLYVNGVIEGSGTSTTAVTQDQVVIGRVYTNYDGEHFIGYISNVRLIIGSAIYTANFTPPTEPLANVSNTQLLTLQHRQPHNNHTFQDSSANSFLVTRSGNATQGTFSPFSPSGWSTLFNGSNGLSVPSNAALSFSGEFTWETFVYFNALPGSGSSASFIMRRSNGASVSSFQFGLNNDTGQYKIFATIAVLIGIFLHLL
jgi:hypothetical protein